MSLGRVRKSRTWPVVKWLACILLVLSLLEILLLSRPPTLERVRPGSSQDVTLEGNGLTEGKRPRVFIASIHRNNENVLKQFWSDRVVQLIEHLGAENVFFSTYESGSQDGTKLELAKLDQRLNSLGVERRVILDPGNQLDEVREVVLEPKEGWVDTGIPRSAMSVGDGHSAPHGSLKIAERSTEGGGGGKYMLRRIPYLAKLRNKVMEPFYNLSSIPSYPGKDDQDEFLTPSGRPKRRVVDLPPQREPYDIILWLNDVHFSLSDITTLLSTRGGKYDAVCALDFHDKAGESFYDTFAARDSTGREPIHAWPYFLSSTTRKAVQRGEAAPVRACWDGVVAFTAKPFYDAAASQADARAAGGITPGKGVVYRGTPDSLAQRHVEGSESCFIHADLTSSITASGRTLRGIWINPSVRVGYDLASYAGANSGTSWRERVLGVWENRLCRVFGSGKRWAERRRVDGRIGEWVEAGRKEGVKRGEVGWCLVDEMQVLFEAGWMHV